MSEAPQPKSLHLSALALGAFFILCTALLAVRITWEMTSLTWQQGPQMVGFSLAHGYYAPLLLSPVLLAIWILVTAIAVLIWKLRHHTITRPTWITLTVAILTLGILSIPQSFYDRIFVAKLAVSPKVNEFLPYSAVEGNEGVTRALINRGVPVDIRNHDGATALHAAAGTGQATLATFLLDHGADPNALTLWRQPPPTRYRKKPARHHPGPYRPRSPPHQRHRRATQASQPRYRPPRNRRAEPPPGPPPAQLSTVTKHSRPFCSLISVPLSLPFTMNLYG